MEFLDHGPCKGKKLQFVGGVMTFMLCSTPTSVGVDDIHTIIRILIEDSLQASSISISMEFERSGEIDIGKNRCCGAQALQVIKGLLTPVIPCNSHLFLACSFT